MQKDFETWHKKKQKAQDIVQRPMFNEREIWWCSLGANVGDEQDGKGENFTRPVLILKKFNRNICLVVPLSSKLKEHIPFYAEISFHGKKQSALLLQIRVVDAKRLRDKMGRLEKEQAVKIKDMIKDFL